MQLFGTGLTRRKKAWLDFLVFDFPYELPNDERLDSKKVVNSRKISIISSRNKTSENRQKIT